MAVTINASTTAGLVQTADTSGVLALQTAGTTAVTISASQNVGIGTATVATNFRAQFLGTAGSNTSAASSGTTQAASAVLRLQGGGGFTGTLDIGQGGGTGSWLQSCDTANLATTYPLFLNPVGGDVGIGTSAPSTRLHVFNSAATSTAFKGNILLTVSSNANGADATISLGDGVANNAVISQLSGALLFGTGGGTPERMRIDSSGRVLVGITSSRPNGGVLQVSAQGQTGVVTYTTSTTSNNAAYFENGNGTVGTITTNGSATAYNTSSDYRLKEAIAPMTGALAKVAQLKPVTYKWKVDGSDGEGFIAHELAEVKPDCVSGDKDAVDADGNPKYQGVDTSFLVATLTAAIQEQQALITQLQADVAALKGATP